MNEQKILFKILDKLGFINKKYPEHDLYYVLTRNGAKAISQYICTYDYDNYDDGPTPATLRQCLWSFADASYYGYCYFRPVTLYDLKRMKYIIQHNDKIYYKDYKSNYIEL